MCGTVNGMADEGERDPNDGSDDLPDQCGDVPNDCDGDGLTDDDESARGIDPTSVESGGGGVTEGREAELGTDPLNGEEDFEPTGIEFGGDTLFGFYSARSAPSLLPVLLALARRRRVGGDPRVNV